MKIKFKETFVSRLEKQIDFIAADSPVRARKFKSELFNLIRKVSLNPLQCRKSIYFEDNNIRDLIYKGYTITFRINDNTIEIFGFLKYQKNPTD